MAILQLSLLQKALIPILDYRGMLGEWIINEYDQVNLTVKMALSKEVATVYVTFENPAELKGFRLVGWRVGTMEELKIARSLLWELCKLTNDEAQLTKHREYWRDTTTFDWDGNPGEHSRFPDAVVA
jgi:hypothetical protein